MPRTYTDNTGIIKPGDGEESGVWGNIVNDNMDILDRAINGVLSLSLSGTTTTLTTGSGSTSGTGTYGQYRVLVLGGSPSGTNTITVAPNDAQKLYFVVNNSGESVVFTQGSGGNVTIANGDSAIIYCDGGGAAAAVVNVTNNLTMGSVNIDGGTIDGVTLGTNSAVTEAQIDNININGNTISSTDTNGNITLDPNGTGSVVIPATSTENAAVEIGLGRSGNGSSYIDFIGDATYSDYGLRIIRNDTGANTVSEITHRGTGPLALNAFDAGSIITYTNNTERLRIDSSGNVGIGTASPSAKLEVNGTAKVGVLNIAGTTVTATAAELNILDGVTATTAELNILDGVTATTAELNYVDGVTSNIQTQLDGKQASLGFTPVQQGGGSGQSTNKVYIGWSGAALKAQVDSTDLGVIHTSGLAAGAVGTYAFARKAGTALWGTTVSGSSLIAAGGVANEFEDANTAFNSASQTLSGTWRIMGDQTANNPGGDHPYSWTLFLRIS